jgi:hypothetical protein
MVAHRTIGPRAAIWSADDRMRRPGLHSCSSLGRPDISPNMLTVRRSKIGPPIYAHLADYDA